MKRIVFLILAFVLVFSFSCKKKKKEQVENQIILEDTLEMQEPILPFEQEPVYSDTTIAESSTDQVLVVDEQTNQITPISDQEVNENQGNIYIIVGSFKKYSNALKTKTYYEHLDYNPTILPQVAGYNRVAIESFTDLQAARKRLKELRIKFNRPDFWLFYTK